MWQPMETCERCGSDNIQLVEDRDDSVGYSGEEWRCMRCGANCEYWMSAEQPDQLNPRFRRRRKREYEHSPLLATT